MTTSVKVEVPTHANWVVDVVVNNSEGQELQHDVLQPGQSQYYTVYDDRVVHVKEIKGS